MPDLLNLSLDLQILLVSGYFAYKTAAIGKVQTDSTEEFVLKIVAYGFIGRLITYLAEGLWRLQGFGWSLEGDSFTLAHSAAVVFFAILSAMIWRTYASRMYSKIMQHFGVYRDDHESSVWNSITAAPAIWDCVQIQIEDGRVLESHFAKLDSNRPLPGVVLNEDGVSVYVTRIHKADGTSDEFEQGNNSGFETITYIPRDRIRQMEISWKIKSRRP
ncbi:hypothetical protein GCM10010869_29010 [Mesorhizobium tianshanense]|uniref:Uncharacterized protein n=1 Tax=Mesorhizobium tianshanense TaxID=39844 RepID=A0A562NG89_9HYPH|nr:hypothetical protein [Mesorhizobium tianshanense]TWI31114.1 hypothetical protein IQ26_04617 [Mesorhizobium tianshanense]GLS37308.1 hypothetical protein GCM10010869_29010 [Mesorhizobium tianshanense]